MNHKTYILRVWRVDQGQMGTQPTESVLRSKQLTLVASLEDCDGERGAPPQRRAFPNLQALYEFLASGAEISGAGVLTTPGEISGAGELNPAVLSGQLHENDPDLFRGD